MKIGNRYDVEWYQRIEHAIQKKLDPYPIADKGDVMILKERVDEAVRFAHMQMKEENQNKGGRKRGRSEGGSSHSKAKKSR
jgi:ATP-dependent RNA helicase DDX47/RRP3